jgi:uncharacterized membrane protein YhhN
MDPCTCQAGTASPGAAHAPDCLRALAVAGARQAAAPAFPVSERTAWLVLAVAWAAYWVVRLLGPEPRIPLETAAKALLMPSLLLWVMAALGPAAPRSLVLGLVFATLGDVALVSFFEVGMLGFLVMQLCYIAGFLALGAAAGLRRRWPVALGYAATWLGVNVALGPAFGDLRIPILLYSLALVTMAALAGGLSIRVALGGAVFLLSDALIGVGRAGLEFPGRSPLVMVTYLLGQYLIVTGWVRLVRPEVSLPV